MNKEDFIKTAMLSGYSSKAAAKKYVMCFPKDNYSSQDFIDLYHGSMHWKGCATDKGLRYVYGVNGRTTAMSNGIIGNSGAGQDWN